MVYNIQLKVLPNQANNGDAISNKPSHNYIYDIEYLK